MDKEHMLALFVLAGIKVLAFDELPNAYWPRAATRARPSCETSPSAKSNRTTTRPW